MYPPQSMSDWPELGTPVELIVKTWSGEGSYTGITLPSPESNLVTIKLNNGYNISFPKSYVKSFKILSNATDKVELDEDKQIQDESLPLVYLIHTGGTIASKVDYKTGAVSATFEPNSLLNSIPEIKEIARIKVIKLGNMWSDDLRPRHWNKMLEASEKAFSDGAKGVVITHGTDTLHLSAAAMAYGWSGGGQRPPGRIVLTGSQRSPDRGSSDAAENIIASVMWAANGPPVSGHRDTSVVILHAESSDGKCAVLPGCASRKYHSSRRDSFKSINQDPLAYITIDNKEIMIKMSDFEPFEARFETPTPSLFDESIKIAEFISGPHLQPSLVESAVKLNFDALLFHGTGLGHLPIANPEEDSIENTKLKIILEDYCNNGGIAVVVAQAIKGPVNLDVYSKGRQQQKIGIIGHKSLCPPGSALVKLHYLLSQGKGREVVSNGWEENLVGENPSFTLD